jgi:uncharacterized protein YfaT (DUF1175 family)
MNLTEIQKKISEALNAHHSCWYDAGGVQGTYNCPECQELRRLRELEQQCSQ